MNAENRIQKLLRLLGGVTRPVAIEYERVSALMPITFSILARYPKALRAARSKILAQIRSPLYVLNQASPFMQVTHQLIGLRPMLKRDFPEVEREIDAAMTEGIAR